jgi:hypothetical protein
MNPFISFCLYVAARVFVQYLKSRPDDSQTADSLRFLLSAMNALKRKNPLTESFLVQLDVDLEALGMRIPKLKSAFPRSGDSVSCSWFLDFHRRFADDKKPGSRNSEPNLARVGAQCDNPENISGILAYRNECHFMKSAEDDANPANAPDIVEPEPESQGAAQSTSNGFGPQAWLSTDQPMAGLHDTNGSRSLRHQGVALTPGSGHLGGFGQSEGSGDSNELSPDGAQSNRPTPNSSTASEQRVPMAAGTLNGSGRNSFDASPVSTHQNITSQGGVEGNSAAFTYPDPTFAMSTGMTPGSRFAMPETPMNDFSLPNGWQDLSGQTGMTPVAEGVLRSLMNMGPMDAMDLSSWDSGN